MISYPKPGQLARVRYRKGLRDTMPLHDAVVVVLIPAAGKPRNHEVLTNSGERCCVPAGHLMPIQNPKPVTRHLTP